MRNLKYIPDGSGGCASREATKEEVQNGRKVAEKAIDDDSFSMRSCYVCNPAHAHLMEDDDFVFMCFGCVFCCVVRHNVVVVVAA